MSAVQLSCHSTEPDGALNLPQTTIMNVKSMYEKASRETLNTTLDTLPPSDKAPLTDVKLCVFEECHRGRSAQPESPLDPLKTRLLYIILVLLAFWVVIYLSLAFSGVI